MLVVTELKLGFAALFDILKMQVKCNSSFKVKLILVLIESNCLMKFVVELFWNFKFSTKILLAHYVKQCHDDLF